jgi:hypothetical protein
MAFLAAFLLIIWAAFGFALQPRTDPALVDCQSALSASILTTALAAPAAGVIEALPGPFRDVATGFCAVLGHNSRGHPSFLLGRIRQFGWRSYFLFVMLLKTTLGLLALSVLGAIRLAGNPELRRRAVYPVAAAAIVLAFAMFSKLNIGVRHILPLYPLMAIVGAGVMAEAAARRPALAWARTALALLVLHVASSAAVFPQYIPYFSEPFRGREHKVLGDSNLDWGQDLLFLREFMEQRGISQIHLRYWGTTLPETVGVRSIPFGLEDQPRGWVACSITLLQGLYSPRAAWLEGREPVARAGRSIWIFYID